MNALKDFTSGNAASQILKFSLPMLIGNVFQQVYSMADAIVVGRYVGGDALAAVGIAMNVTHFLVAALIGLTTGASVIISQFLGAKKHEELRRTVSTSVIFLAGLSLAISALGVALAPLTLRLLNAPQETLADAALYLRILMAGMAFPVFYNMYTAYLRALGDSRSPLFILICCTFLNIALDLLFVVRFHWGVAGAAVATVISQAVSAVLCFLYVRKSVPLLHVARLAFDRPLFGAVLKYGTPAAIQLSLVSLANLTITRLINSFGAAAMAGITAAAKIDQLAIMPLSSISMALSTFVAQNMGANQESRATKGFKTSLALMVGVAAGTSALLLAFGPGLISMFVNQSEPGSAEITRVGLYYLNIIVLFYFLFAFLFGFNGFFRGAGDAVIAMAFPVASLAVRTASAYLLVNLAGMGAEALAWSIPVGWGITSLASWAYYKKRLWAGKIIVGAISRGNQSDEKPPHSLDST
jgi:putative MATE family efflux protein